MVLTKPHIKRRNGRWSVHSLYGSGSAKTLSEAIFLARQYAVELIPYKQVWLQVSGRWTRFV